MVKFGDKPQQIFENKVLDDLYETRCDHLKAILNKLYKRPEEVEEIQQTERELCDAINNLIKDEEVKKILIEKLNEYEGSIFEETNEWECLYYKMGFTDGICFQEELKEIIEIGKDTTCKK